MHCLVVYTLCHVYRKRANKLNYRMVSCHQNHYNSFRLSRSAILFCTSAAAGPDISTLRLLTFTLPKFRMPDPSATLLSPLRSPSLLLLLLLEGALGESMSC